MPRDQGRDGDGKVLSRLLRRAKAGDVAAQLALGDHYQTGDIVDKDESAAYDWFLRAAGADEPEALYEVARCHQHGIGVPVDHEQAASWYARSAEHGHAAARTSLAYAYRNGRGVPTDHERAFELFSLAAEQGYASAQHGLYFCYLEGRAVPRDPDRALDFLRKAAGSGLASAQANFAAVLLQQGKDEEAVALLRQAAEKNEYAQYLLGWCHASGRGVDRDLAQAQRWLRRSIESKPYSEQAPGRRRLLRYVRFERVFRFSPRTMLRVTQILGLALLAYHAATEPIRLPLVAVLIGVGLVMGLFLAAGFAAILATRSDNPIQADALDKGLHGPRKLASLPRLAAGVLGEDGLFALPLLYIGMSPLTVCAAAALFGAMHYPAYGPGLSAFKVPIYAAMLVLLLPYGIWVVTFVHLLIDVLLWRFEPRQ